MFGENNKDVVRQFFEALNQGNMAMIDEALAPTYAGHFIGMVAAPLSRDAFKQFMSMSLTTFPDFHHEVVDIFAEGDKVAVRLRYSGTQHGVFMGLPPTGTQVVFEGINVFYLAHGKITHHWSVSDMLGMQQQLGMLAAPPQPTTA